MGGPRTESRQWRTTVVIAVAVLLVALIAHTGAVESSKWRRMANAQANSSARGNHARANNRRYKEHNTELAEKRAKWKKQHEHQKKAEVFHKSPKKSMFVDMEAKTFENGEGGFQMVGQFKHRVKQSMPMYLQHGAGRESDFEAWRLFGEVKTVPKVFNFRENRFRQHWGGCVPYVCLGDRKKGECAAAPGGEDASFASVYAEFIQKKQASAVRSFYFGLYEPNETKLFNRVIILTAECKSSNPHCAVTFIDPETRMELDAPPGAKLAALVKGKGDRFITSSNYRFDATKVGLAKIVTGLSHITDKRFKFTHAVMRLSYCPPTFPSKKCIPRGEIVGNVAITPLGKGAVCPTKAMAGAKMMPNVLILGGKCGCPKLAKECEVPQNKFDEMKCPDDSRVLSKFGVAHKLLEKMAPH